MIVILNGSVGVGKTSVSWALQELFDKAVMLDGDFIGAVHPFEIYDRKRIDHLYQTFAHLVKFHTSHGYSNYILNYVFETPEQIRALHDLLSPLHSEIRAIYLTCSETEQEKRIKARHTDQTDWELKRFKELNNILKKSAWNGDIGQRIDTTDLSVKAVAQIIWELL